MIKTINNKIIKTNNNFKNVFVGFSFVLSFVVLFLNINLVSAADITPPTVNMTYSANTAGVGKETITATYSEAVSSNPTISINQPGTIDITNAPMIAPGSTWTARTAAETNPWMSVTYGNGLFVAVAQSGTNQVMTSPDGITWTARTVPTGSYWQSVVYGNGMFVAVAYTGTNRVMTSPDGITWTVRTVPQANSWRSVTYGNSLFVAISSDGTNRVMTSPDGITWTVRTSPSLTWYGVTYGNGMFAAVAADSGTTSAIMTSTDGITWTSRTTPTMYNLYSISYGNGKFVAAGYNNMMTSPDGITWTGRSIPISYISYVSYGNGLFVMTSNSYNYLATSVDGITWTVRQLMVSGTAWYSATYGNGKFIVVGTSGVMDSSANFTYDYYVKKANGSTYVDGVATVSLSSVTDLSGNTSVAPTNNTFNIDTTGPTVSLSYTANIAKAGTQTITATYSEAIVGTPTISIDQPGSSDITNAPMSGSGTTWTYNYTVNTTNGISYIDGTATVSLSQVANAGGKVSSYPTNNTFIIDTTLPTVAFTYTPNPVKAGTQTITATYSEEIISTPTISIDQPGSSDITNASMVNTGGQVWTSRAPTAWNWDSVAYGNGLFVSVSSNGQAMTSPDGITWTNRTASETNNWTSVTYGNGLFVAVASTGTNRIMTSLDGIIWTAQAAAEDNVWMSVTYGNGLFVAVSNNGTNRVMTSPDGITWTARSSSTSSSWQSVTYGNGKFVAVAYGAVMTSSNGATWTSQTAAEANSWYGVTYGNGLFVAVAVDGNNRIMTSPDGVTWTARLASEADSWQSVVYGNGLFVAVSNNGTNRVMTSPAISFSYTYTVNTADGSTYIDGQTIVTLSFVTDLAANTVVPINSINENTGNRFIIDTTPASVAITYSTNPANTGTQTIKAMYSEAISSIPTVSIDQPGTTDIVNATMIPPGSVWTSRTSPQSNPWYSIAYGNGLFVAVSSSGTNRVITSPDGITWTLQNASTVDSWYSVTYGNGLFVAVANSGAVMTSSNGINWTTRISALGSTLYSVTYGNGLFVAVGTSGVMTSPNGITWVARTPSVSTSWQSVTYGNGLFVAVANSNVMTSPDGIVWTSKTNIPASAWYSITYGNGLFVAVSTGGQLMTSQDSIAWTLRSVPAFGWYSVMYADNLFVATGANAIITSQNGINWTSRTPTSNAYWYGLGYANGIFVSTSNGGLISTSRGGGYYYDYTVNKANGSTYLDGTANVTLSNTADMAGNITGAPTGNTFEINTSAATVALTYTRSRVSAGAQVITATYSKPIVGTPNISIDQPGSTDITNVPMTGSGKVWTYSYTVNAANGSTYIDGTTTVSLSSMVDVDGNTVNSPTNNTFVIDTSSPTVTLSYSANPAQAGTEIVTATYSETVVGTPNISIDQPGSTDITNAPMSGSGTVFTYNYTVYGSTGSTYIDGTATVSLSSVTDTDNNLFLTPTNNTFVINTSGTSVSLTYSANPAKAGVNTITATYAKAIVGTPTISINQQGTTDITNAPMTGSGTVWTYDYTVNAATGNTYIDGNATVTLSPLVDVDGNISSTVPTNNTFVIDTLIPTVAITYSNTPMTVGTQTITATYSKPIVGTPNISIDQPGSTDIINAPMTGSGTTWTYTYTVNTANGSTYIDGTATVSLSSILDLAGNTAAAPTNNTIVINTNGSSVDLSYSSNPAGVGIETITATYSDVVVGTPNISINQPGTADVSSVAMNTPLSVWTSRTASINGSWYGVAYGNGLFVAVSSGANQVMTSPDGINWTTRTGAATNIYAINYSNGLFVAVGSSVAMTSPDGITWTSRTVPSASWQSVTYGNGQFVAVSTSGTAMTSPDGITWTSRSGATPVHGWYGVSYGNGMYVAVSYDGSGYAMSSPDGITWTNRTTPSSGGWWSVTYGNGTFVAVSGGIAMTSPDGITWTSRTTVGSGWRYVTYAKGLFVAVSNTANQVMTSSDGITWSLKYAPSGAWYSVAYGNNTFVAVSTSGINQVATSSSNFTYDYIVNKANGSTYVDGVATVSLSSIPNISGKLSNSPTNNTFTIDTTGSTVDLTYSANIAKAGTQTITATYSDSVVDTPTISIDQPGSSDIINAPMSGSGKVWTYNYTVNTTNGTTYIDGVATVSLSRVTNLGGKVSSAPTNNTFIIDTTQPTVVFTYTPNPAKAGTQTITATYSEEIVGTPTISIDQPGSSDTTNAAMTNAGGSSWTARTPTAWNWNSVVYGNGIFVAVTNSTNQVATSPDGITWTNRVVPENNQWMSVTYGNGLFVAVSPIGVNRVMTSPDGITWTARTAAENNSWQSVTYGNGLFVAVAYSGTNRIMTSSDGIVWTVRTAPQNNSWQSVTYGNGLFVSVANYGTNQVMTSPDGITWTARSASSLSGWQSVTYGNGKFVAVAYYGSNQVMTSTDGITWVSRVAAEANSWYGVAYGNGLFVAVSVDGTNRIMTSPDGITWTAKAATEANNWSAITYGNGTFVAVSSSGTNRVMTSPSFSYSYTYTVNAANGSSYIDGVAIASLSYITDLAGNTLVPPTATSQTNGNRFIIDTTSPSVAISYSSNPAGTGTETIKAVYSEAISTVPTISIDQPGSTDITNAVMTAPGSVWVARTASESSSWYNVTYANGLFVAVSQSGGKVMTSPDGATWTSRTSASASTWYSITYGNGLFVVVGSNAVMTSPNGINWTSRTPASSTTWQSVTYANGIFIAVGSNAIMTSVDGINWISRTSPSSNSWTSVTYGNGTFVALSGSSQVMTSTDGINWTSRVSIASTSWSYLAYGNGLFVAANSSQIMTSPDGINWTLRTSVISNIGSLTYGGGLFVATGYYAVAMTSSDGINWTSRTSAVNGVYFYSIAYGNGTFVAVSNSGANQVMTSRGGGYYYDYTVNKANGSTYIDGTANVTLSNTADMAGNITGAPTGNSFAIDTSSSSVALTYSKSISNAGAQVITATYSKPIVGTPNISIDQPGTTDITNAPMTGSGTTWSYTYTVNTANGTTYKDGLATVSLSSILDTDGNTARPPTNTTFVIDTTGPSAVVTYSPNRRVNSGTSIVITATFTEDMAPSPVPKIAISGANTLAAADMTSIDSTHYSYTYTVGAGDGLATVTLSTGTDIATNTVNPVPNSGATFVVDNTIPETVITLICSTAGNGCTTVGQASNPQESYNVQKITGTASGTDQGGAINSVNISVKDTTTNKWYTGSAFTDNAETYHPTVGTTAWTYNFSNGSLVIGHTYLINIKTIDEALNTSIVSLSFKFTNSPPVISNIVASQSITGEVNITYNVTDAESTQTTNYLFYGADATLGSDITSSSNFLTVSDGTHFPISGSIIIDDEIISYTSKSGNTLQGLNRGMLNTTAFAHSMGNSVYIKAVSVSGTGIGLSNIGTGKTISWLAQTDADGYKSASAVVKIVSNDGSISSMIGSLVSSPFSIDAIKPVSAVTFDAGVVGVAGGATVNIPMPANKTTVDYKISDNNVTNSYPTTTGWVNMTGDVTIPWTFDSDVEVKSLKYQFRDDHNNVTPEQTIYTPTPISSSSFIIQDTSNLSNVPPYYDAYIGWQSVDATGFGSYKLEQSTSTDNITYGEYTNVTDASFEYVGSNYYVYRNLNPNLFYKFRLAVIGDDGNISIRTSPVTMRADGVQNYGEGGGGSALTAPKVENVTVVQNEDKTVTADYKLTDTSLSKKVNPNYEAYIFYNIGITLPNNALVSDTIKLSDASKLKSSGYIQINNEVINYTGKTGNTLTGVTRGTWPTNNSSGRATRVNTNLLAGTPVWVMASSTTPVSVTNNIIATGQNNSIVWNTYDETGLAGSLYNNVDIRVLVHDNQDVPSGPLSSQNDYSENGTLNDLDLTVPTISFETASSSGLESISPATFNLNLGRAYPFNSTVNYRVTGTAIGGGVDYTLADGVATIVAGQTTTSLTSLIVNNNLARTNKTIIITLSNPVNATLGLNTVHTYTIINHAEDLVSPVVTLVGSGEMHVISGTTFTDPGATASDNIDGNITSSIVVTNLPDMNRPSLSPYVVTYTATDSSNNSGSITRNVYVDDANSVTHNISATAGSNGTISSSGVTAVTVHTDKTYTITPNSGFRVDNLIVDGVSLAPATTYTFTNVTTSHTISVSFVAILDILAPVITLNGSDAVSITKDSTYTELGATALDNVDGVVSVVTSGSVVSSVVGNYTITYTATDTAGNVSTKTRTVNVTLSSTYNITATSGSNGTISPSGVTSVASGTNKIYTITPNEGYNVSTFNVDGVSLAPVLSYTFTNVTVDHTISVTFAAVPDTTAPVITLGGDNPMSVVLGDTFVDPGATAVDNIDGSIPVTVTGTVNSSSVGVYTLTYRATDLTGNMSVVTRTVNVILAPTYNITATVDSNGTISPAGVTAVASATNQIYTITPNEGYSVDVLTVDGVRLISATTYTFSNVTRTHTIDVTFTLNPDTVAPVITVLGDNPMSVVLGDTFTDPGATAQDDRDGDTSSLIKTTGTVNASAVGTYFITYTVSDAARNSTTVNRTVKVVYAPTYDIVSSSGSNGTISPLGTTAVSSTTDQIYTITPDENYKVSSLIVDGVNLTVSDIYTFTNVIAPHTIRVTFAPLDSLPPIITIIGDNPMSINSGETFVDPGATAVAAITGESLEVVATGTINTSVASSENVITYTATDSYGNTSTLKRTVNILDITGPVISNIVVPVKTSTVAVITWDTNEPATSQLYYGTETGVLSRITVLDSVLSIHHAVTLSSETKDEAGVDNTLVTNTSYFYKISSSDLSNNNTKSEENTFVTDVAVVSGGGGGGVVYSSPVADTTAPSISNVEISDITAFGASVSFNTDEDALSFVEYGKDSSYGDIFANNKWSKEHKVNLRGLKLGTDYHIKVVVVDKSGNLTTGEDKIFKTKFFSEDTSDLVKVDNIEQFQNEIESTIESILPALVPPFVEEPKISKITENSVTVSYRTNIKTFPVVSYVEDALFDSQKENPYSVEISDMKEKTYDHELTVLNLKPNTKYHLQARAFSLPQVIGKSGDLTFTTAASKIQGSVIDIKKDSFGVVWSTDEPTSSIVEYKNIKTGRISRIVDDIKNRSHSIKVENLSPGTYYEVDISGLNEKGNIVEGGASINVKTSTDNTAPAITNLKVESALIIGLADRVQTIISWQTDEPSTSVVYYEEGPGSATKVLSNSQKDLELTKNHVVILSSLKSGTVYRFTVESTDDANNMTKPPIRTIITPKKTESIVDVIFKNFDSTFNFINNVR